MRHVFARIFQWANKLVAFFTSALKIIFTLIAVLVSVIIPKLLMHSAVVPLAGFLSAVFWFWSALVPIPKDFLVIVPIGCTSVGCRMSHHFVKSPAGRQLLCASPVS